MSGADKYIKSVSHGKYGVDPECIPLCPICDQPMWAGEPLELQACDAGPGNPDLIRIVHLACEETEDSEDDTDEDDE